MLLWIACAVLTAAVLAVVLRPLLAAPAARNAGEREADLAVYRDQLAEIEADHARGLINGAELEAARREVARRLLGVAGDSGGSTVGTPVAATSGGQAVALTPYFVAGLVPLVAIGLYITLGSPSLPSQPFTAANTSLEKTDVAILVERVEARLQQNPNDGQGWDVIAPIYFKMKRYRDAADAYAQAGRLLGETVARLGGFAESSVLAANGIVGEDARKAYERVLLLEPGRIEPRFWLALAKEQDGRLVEALADYRQLLAESGPEVRWRGSVQQRVAGIDKRLGAPTAPGSPGPTADQVAAAAGMSEKDREQMISGMVLGLAERLKANGRDGAGWQRLVRAYVVLGRRDAAIAALGDARKNLAADDKALADLAALAKTLGLES